MEASNNYISRVLELISEQLPPKQKSGGTLPPKSYDPTTRRADNKKSSGSDSIKQQQQNLVNKGYFIGTSGPNKNGVDGVEGKKTQYAQHALNSGIDAATYNNIYKQQNPELTQTIETLFGTQVANTTVTQPQTVSKTTQSNSQVQGGSTPQQKSPGQKAKVINTIHPKNW